MGEQSVIKITVEITRDRFLDLKKRFEGDVGQVVAQAIEYAAGPDDQSVPLSQNTLRNVCSLLGVEAINSERQLVESIQKRFHCENGTVQIQLDPNVTQAMEEVARSNRLPLSEVVKNFFELAVANGWFETTWDLRSLLFTPTQWKEVKASLGGLPSDARTIVKILKDWAQMQAAARIPQASDGEASAGAGIEPTPMPNF